MSDFATMVRGTKDKKVSRKDNVIAWLCEKIKKDRTIDVIKKGILFSNYKEVLKKVEDNTATDKDTKPYTYNGNFLEIKESDLTFKELNKYFKDNGISIKIKNCGKDGWKIIREQEQSTTDSDNK